MSHILPTSTEHKTASLADEEILHIASLAAHTTLNTYKPMEINIERSPSTLMSKRGSNSEPFAHDALPLGHSSI